MEAAIRWSPHSADRFLVVDLSDATLTLKEVEGPRNEQIKSRAVSRSSKLPNFAALAWSPLEEPIIGLGLVSGNASLIKLGENGRTSETVATFKAKQQRKCNSVALNREGWFAVSLERARSDFCLNVYDTASARSEGTDPIRRLCAAELVSSVRFFDSAPQELIATTQRSFLRLYDLRGRLYYFADYAIC
jgi:WD repeat-containing protein mio